MYRFTRMNDSSQARNALPKMIVLGNVVLPNFRRSKENGRRHSPSPNIEMGKAAKPTAYTATQSGQPHARVSDPDEVERMMVAARHAGGRLAERDASADHDGLPARLRASELIALAGTRST